MITSFLPVSLLANTTIAASRSPPTTTTLLLRRTPVRRHRLVASVTNSGVEEEEETAGSTNGSLPGLPPVEEEDDDEFCPVDCVTEFKTEEEFRRHLDRAKATGALLVVDFYRTSCGSCKYIERGFVRLCKGSGDDDGTSSVVFLKHNVIDEYDEQSEVAERLRIKVVPLFHFYKDGVLVESFATRDKDRIIAAIRKYASIEPEEELQE